MMSSKLSNSQLQQLLDSAYERFHRKTFVADDPIGIPHRFTKKQDVEISGFLAATIAWGNRKSIINSANKICEMMDDSPHEFILNHEARDLKDFETFAHRTFQATDILYFIERLRVHFTRNESLESMFTDGMSNSDQHVGAGLSHFHKSFFELDFAPQRTRKHVATPDRKSACKRLNMFLRWMVRPASSGVDFGIWNNIKTHQLLLPLDVHTHRVATELGLLKRKQSDWAACLEVTESLRSFDASDPVKYDFALFGMGVNGEI